MTQKEHDGDSHNVRWADLQYYASDQAQMLRKLHSEMLKRKLNFSAYLIEMACEAVVTEAQERLKKTA